MELYTTRLYSSTARSDATPNPPKKNNHLISLLSLFSRPHPSLLSSSMSSSCLYTPSLLRLTGFRLRGRTIPCLVLPLTTTGLCFLVNGVCLAFLRARPTPLVFLALSLLVVSSLTPVLFLLKSLVPLALGISLVFHSPQQLSKMPAFAPLLLLLTIDLTSMTFLPFVLKMKN